MENRPINYVLLLKLRVPLIMVMVLGLYHLVFSKTWGAYQQHHSLKNAVAVHTVGVNAKYTRRRAGEIDRLHRRIEVDTLKWKNQLWDVASALSSTYASPLNSFPPVQRFSEQEGDLLVQTVAFKGEYRNLIQVLKEISRQKHIGVPHSISLVRKARDKQTVLSIDMAGKAKD